MSDGKVVKVVLQLENGQYIGTLQATGREHQAYSRQVVTSSEAAAGAVDSVAAALRGVATANKNAAGDQFIASLRDQVAVSGKSAEELLRYRAAQAGVAAQASPLILQLQHQRAAQQAAAEAARNEEAAQREAAAAKQRATGQQAAFLAGLREEVALQGKSHTEILRYRAAQMGVSGGAEQYIQALEAANKAHGRGTISAAQHAAAMRMLPAQMTDVVTSVASGMPIWMVAIQQGGQIKDSFGGAGAALRAMAGAVTPAVAGIGLLAGMAGVAALAYHQGSAEADEFRRGIVMSGNAAGTTVGQLTDMARAIAEVTGTQGAASAALAQMAGSGAVARENLQQFAQTAMDLERYVGVPVKAVVGDLESLAKAPLQASIKLNEQYHYLTDAVYSHIKALEDQGKKEEAGAVAQRAYISAFEARKNELVANLGYIERAWAGVTGAAKKGWDAILNIGRATTDEQNLAQLRENLARQQERNSNLGIKEGKATADLKEEIRLLEHKIAMNNANASAVAGQAKQTEALAEWDKVVTANLSKQAREAQEIENIRQKGLAAGKDLAAIEKEIAAYKAKNADKGGSKDLERQKSLLAELAGLSSSFYKDWEELNKLFKQGKLTQEQLVQAQEALLKKQPAIKEAREAELKVLQRQYQMEVSLAEELAQVEVSRSQAVYAGRQAVLDYARGVDEATRLLEVERQTVTGTASQRSLAVELLRIELELERQLEAIRTNKGFTQADRDEQAKNARDAAAQARANATSRAELDHVRELRTELQRVTEQYEQGLTNAAMQGGKSLKEYVLGMLRTTAFRIALQPVASASAQLLASATGAAGVTSGAGGAGGVMGLMNTGSALYSALTTGVSGSIAAGFAKFAGSAVGQTLGLSNSAAIVGNNPSAFVPAGGQLTGLGSSIGAGLGMLGSGFLGYGISSALSGGYSAGKGVNAIAGIASAIPGIGPIAGVIGGLINRAFGRKLADMGIEGTLGGSAGFEGSGYQYLKGGWLRSDKTTYQALDADTTRALSESFRAIQAQVGAFATTLGLQTDRIASFTTSLKISTNGLDDAAIQAKIQEALAKGSNELAEQVLGSWTHSTEQVTEAILTSGWSDATDAVFQDITRTVTTSTYAASEYAKAGEQAIDTLTRLATSFGTVNALSDAMGYGFHQASLAGANAASRIADAFGGLEALTQSLGTYVSNYYTDTEQRAATARSASRALADVGLDFSAERLLSATRPQIRAFVEGVMAEFGADSTQYAAAVNQANALAAITEPLQSAAQSMAASTTAATDAMREYEARIKAIADERKSLQDELDELTMTRLQLLDKERAAIDASNQALWDQLQAARDAKEVSDQRKGLQDELNGLTDTAAQALARQRDALHESNRALFDQVQALRLQQQLLAEVPALIDKYTTDAQRQASSYARIAADLGAAGIGVSAEALMGATKAQIAEAVLAIHAMGDTTDDTRLALVRAASSLSDLKDAATSAANTAADAALSSLQRSIEAEKAAIAEAANARIEALRKEAEAQKAAQETASEALATAKRLAESLGRAVRTLRGQVESAAVQDLAAARRFIADAASAAASTGVLPDEDALARAIESVTADQQQRYGTYADWEAAQLDQANQLAALGAVGEVQMTVAERQLAATKGQAVLLEEQIKATQDGATAATRALDDQLKAAQERLAVLRDSNAALKSIAASSAGFEAALARLAAAQSASTVGGGGGGGASGAPSGATRGSAVLNGPMGSQYDPRSGTFYAGGSGVPYSAKDLGAAAIDMVNAGQARELYDLAVANGVTAAMLGQWTGTSAADLNAWAREQGLPAFANGTNYVKRTGLALVHEGEEIVPKRYNPAAQGAGAWAPASTISRNMAERSGGAESALQAVVATLAGAVDRLASSNGPGLSSEDSNNLRRMRLVLEGAANGQFELGVKQS